MDKLLFEYPLKEHIRVFLRLETLFIQFERNRLALSADNHFQSLKFFLEILEILERGDTRSELTKELVRLSQSFINLRQNPDVDSDKLDNFLKQINQLHQWVTTYQGKFGEKLRKNAFIDTIRHRLSIPGGGSSFDCPDLFMFLNKPKQQRQEQLASWLQDIKGVKTSIDVILRIMRESGMWRQQVAPLGSYMIETPDKPLQMLRVKLPANSEIFPEFSCGKHRSSIHFMKFDEQHRKIPQAKEINFDLACCY